MEHLMKQYSDLSMRISELLQEKDRVIVAIDGDAAAGKSTAAAFLQRDFDAAVIHMDDFFLPTELRTPERLRTPGGNVHYERFMVEVLPWLHSRSRFTYRHFDCSIMDYQGTCEVKDSPLIVVEGSYALHPLFSRYYDLSAFCYVCTEAQKARILAREGEKRLEQYLNQWIPMEKCYQNAMLISGRADLLFEMDWVLNK